MSSDRALILLSALLVVTAVLLGQIKDLLLAGPPESPPRRVEAGSEPRPEPSAFLTYAPPPLARFEEAFGRPAFSRTRRPAAAPRDPEPAAPLRARLRGVVHIGNSAMALLSADGSQRPMQVARGQRFEGWRLDQIHATQVVLSRSGRSLTLALPYSEHPSGSR